MMFMPLLMFFGLIPLFRMVRGKHGNGDENGGEHHEGEDDVMVRMVISK